MHAKLSLGGESWNHRTTCGHTGTNAFQQSSLSGTAGADSRCEWRQADTHRGSRCTLCSKTLSDATCHENLRLGRWRKPIKAKQEQFFFSVFESKHVTSARPMHQCLWRPQKSMPSTAAGLKYYLPQHCSCRLKDTLRNVLFLCSEMNPNFILHPKMFSNMFLCVSVSR